MTRKENSFSSFLTGPGRLSIPVFVLAMLVGLGTIPSDDGLAGERGRKVKASKQPLILVMNYPYQITGAGKTKIHTTLFKPDFTPAAGAVVKVNGKQVGKADDNGVCIFDYVPGAQQSHLLLATLKTGGRTYRVQKTFASNSRTESFRSDQLFVYTDRAVYNPGDDIRVRLLAWELLSDYKAIKGAEVSLLLQTPQGKVFAGEKLKTNAYGIAAAKLPLAQNMKEGDYELVVLYNKARETARLRVERFVPPIIEIDHNLKRFLTPAQKKLPVEAKLAWFAGGKPKQAKVSLAVLDPSGKSIFDTALAQSEPAVFKVTLVSKDLDRIRKGLSAEQSFKTVLKATDEYGRTSEVKRDMVYTQRPYRAVLEFDKDDYPAGETVKLQAKVVDLDGKPARAIPLVCEVEQFKVKVKATTDDNGVAEFSFKMGQGPGTAVVTSPVMPVPLATGAVRFNQPKPMTSKVKEPPHKQGIQTHFDVVFDDRYRPIEKVVHVDFTDLSGGLVVSTTIPISKEGGKYIAKGTVTAQTWGTMLANLYVAAVEKKTVKTGQKLSIKNVGFITEGQHVTLHPDSEATITIKGLKPRVRPGEKMEITVSVKTLSGENAAVGAALVDNAVISLLDPLEVTPMDHFYNPQRKVISTGGAGVLTWPVVDRNWGNPWRDIAYTNWGWKGPGGMVGEGGDEEGEAFGSGGAGVGAVGSGGGGATLGGAVMGAQGKGMLKSKKTMAAKMSMATVMSKEEAKPAMADDFGNGDMAEMEADEDMAIGGGDTGVARDRSRGKKKKKRSPRKRITIRTKFPETALWEPLLETKNTELKLSLTFPDAITVQRLTLVASDRSGSLGLLHQDIEVRQDLFVQSDLPATMALGDELKVVTVVQNLSGADVEVTVTPTTSGLELVGPPERRVKVANGEAEPVEWTVRSTFCGKVGYSAAAENGAFKDSETKGFFVLPTGKPTVRIEEGKVSSGRAFETKVRLDKKATWSTVFLNVSFPNVIPAIQAWGAMEEIPMAYVGVSGIASRAILDAALLEWGFKNDMSKKWIDDLKGRLSRAAAELTASQLPEGGWGWFYMADASQNRDGFRVSVYLTAYALQALTAVADAGLLADKLPMQKAVSFLLKSRNKEGLYSPGGAWFWEVNAPETDWALSAEMFEIIVRSQKHSEKKPGPELKKLRKLIEKNLSTNPQNPAVLAHGISALYHWSKWVPGKGLDKKLGGWIGQLLKMKREGYWEPHWYHAYGGTVELNALILRLLRDMGGDRYDAVVYEIVTYLLSTREAWGSWHNEIGTANAVLALLAAGAGSKQEKASTVTVTVNGQKVREVAIDPRAPFLSAANLRYLELTSHMQPGENTVKVSYDGNLTAPLVVETNQWGVKKAKARSRVKGTLSIRRIAPAEAALGQPVDVILDVNTDHPAGHVQIVDNIPSNMEVDKPSLEKLVKDGKVLAFNIRDDSVAFFIAKLQDERSFTYRLVATREGTSEHRGAEVSTRFARGFKPGRIVGGAITVSN